MQIFNLIQYAGIKAEKYISAQCGGRYTRKEAYHIGGIGVGGLRYKSGIGDIDFLDTQERFRANTETFRQGLGLYVRSLSFNYLLAIPSQEITSISLSKKTDSLQQTGFSWTRRLMNMGMPYHYARVMLLEQEIVETHDMFLTIDTLERSIVFRVKRQNPTKILQYFQYGPFADRFSEDIKWYEYV